MSGLAATAAAAINPAGIEFQVNTYTYGPQMAPAVAAGSGGFVVAWESNVQDGEFAGVFARRFSASGAGVATEFQVTTFTLGYQYGAAVAMDAEGDFVIVWQSFGQDGFSNGLFAQRFASTGAALGSEFQVNAHTVNDERDATVSMTPNGQFVVAWTSFPGDTSSDAVFAQRFASSGARIGVEFQVNSFTSQTQAAAAVDMANDGRFVIVWQSYGQDGASYGVFAQRFDSAGVAQGAEVQVNSVATGAQLRPAVAMAPGGDFVVAWDSYPQDGAFNGVFARRFDSTGIAQGVEFQINTVTASEQLDPALGIGASGSFVVTWDSFGEDGYSRGVFAREFDSSGTPLASAFQVNTYTNATQNLAAIANGVGGFVVVWQSSGQDDGDYGVFAQRLVELAVLDIDGDGAVEPLTDGLLVLRFLFGFGGTALTNNATGVACARCSAAQIIPYLSGLGMTLDIDGSGGMNAPLTDGLLFLRYEFGFSGSTLTNNATAPTCTRCTGVAVIEYLEPLT
jgi:hypothetical protein